MDKIFTTKNKKIAATIGLFIVGWNAVASAIGYALPAFISDPFVGKISLLTIAGATTVMTIFMLQEY